MGGSIYVITAIIIAVSLIVVIFHKFFEGKRSEGFFDEPMIAIDNHEDIERAKDR